jgi:hypothetical protein
MVERELQHETIGRGELFILSHPETEGIFSGYGLTTDSGHKDELVGLLMVDRPHTADPAWLQSVTDTFGQCRLFPMVATGERGVLCRMQIESDSVQHIRRFSSDYGIEIQKTLEPILEDPPAPLLRLRWNEDSRAWLSEFAVSNELSPEIREVFERTGFGCLAVEADIGIVHVCHASDQDIDGFSDNPIHYQWQLIKMPTAPLIRLDVVVLDNPTSPFKLESFLNIDAPDQAAVLSSLANQDRLYLAFYGTDLSYRYTKVIRHDEQQWQYLDELIQVAERYLHSLEPGGRDFDRAKADFMLHFN